MKPTDKGLQLVQTISRQFNLSEFQAINITYGFTVTPEYFLQWEDESNIIENVEYEVIEENNDR